MKLSFFFLFAFLPVNINAQTLRINEFITLNSSSNTDKDGEYSNWIEIYNSGDDSVSIEGWTLADNSTAPAGWKFPAIKIAGKSYLIVFVSGKNISTAGEELHTNFKLSGDGEYLALIDSSGTVVSEFNPFPPQAPNFSYAFFDSQYSSTAAPTPGSKNILFHNQLSTPPQFSHEHGFYSAPFNVQITSETAGNIYYTTNGSIPNAVNGILYTAPVQISTTTVLRAAVVGEDSSKSATATATYLFLDSVINQPDNPPGYPALWGPYFETGQGLEGGIAIGDYGMDPEITQDPAYADLMDDALLSIPTISIVTDIDNLFSHSTHPDTGGIYIYTGPADFGGPELGEDWERPVSIEYFNGGDSIDFQINAGLKLHGGHSRRPEKTPKHSFRVVFRSEYGASQLNVPLFGKDAASSFKSFFLRAGFGNMWTHHSASERLKTQHIHDQWGKQAQLDMGHPAGHGSYAHLYINGIYWGVYNPTERIDNDYAETYLGGNKGDYDVIKDYAEVVSGNNEAWNAMMNLANSSAVTNTNYMRLQGKNTDGSDNPAYPAYLDVDNFIDYMLINFYGANWDWDHHNWVVVRNKVQPGKGFKFFSWDAEHIIEDINANILNENNTGYPSGLFQRLRQNALFKRRFSDRVQLHFFNNGALTTEAGSARWMLFADQIDTAIIAESARWGDYRRDVHPWRPGGTYLLYTKEHWIAEQSFLIDTYFPNRGNTFITHLKSASLFPNTAAPQFLINGSLVTQKIISAGDSLTMQTSGGTTYYTTNGADPLTMAGTISPDAVQYSGKIVLTQSTHVKARTVVSNVWSALNEQFFALPADLSNLRITEIHYHPLDEDTIGGGNFEFVELKNTGSSPLDLSGIEFVNGVAYTFSANTILNPGAYIVLSSNQFYFNQRYGFTPFGVFDGSLDNSGERIVLITPSGDTLINLVYDDKAPWPVSPDGGGYSLVPVDVNAFGDPSDPAFWRVSQKVHGSPGSDDGTTDVNNNRQNTISKEYSLYQNYPNPFNPVTKIKYSIPYNSFVVLKIYNILGQEVTTLLKGMQRPGNYEVMFDGKGLASGIYLYQMKAGNFVGVKKLMLLK